MILILIIPNKIYPNFFQLTSLSIVKMNQKEGQERVLIEKRRKKKRRIREEG